MTQKIDVKKIGIVSIGAVLSLLLLSSVGAIKAQASITEQLSVGSTGSQVTELQTFLATDSSVYPEGLTTSYFGSLTRSAVIRFQAKYGIAQVGSVGPITRAKINQLENPGMGADISAPILSVPFVQTNSTNATVSWNTSEASRGKLVYSTTPVIIGNSFEATGVVGLEPTVLSGLTAPYDAVPRFSQSISVLNLTPNTTYFYTVLAIDGSNNLSMSLPATFHTNQ